MAVEWDERERQTNLEKHEVDFSRAARIFTNPVLTRIDDREDYGEARWIALGRWGDDYMVVVYTWRGGNRRIISAWKAGRDDRETYNNSVPGRA